MKVHIGKYENWIGPYQVVDWFKPIFGEDRIEKFTNGKVFDKLSDWTMPLFTWVEKHKPKRTEKIHIDKWDTWSADHTLSLMIVPMLIQLKETKHGAPFTDDEDVPEHLRSTSAPPIDHDKTDTDDNFFERFDWILDEMIWAMTQIRDDDWESQFHTGVSDYIDKKVVIPADEHDDPEIEGDLVMFEMIEGPKHTAKFDKEGYIKYADRIKNGTRLFGKYFQSLWN